MLEKGIIACRAAIANGRTTSTALVREALENISDPQGEGSRAYTDVFADRALVEASSADQQGGGSPGRLHGIPISVKDLFDIEGYVTRAGSTVLSSQPAATADAKAVQRLRAEGAIIIGRTNMTEFAFSGLGLNPHYDTPANPWDRVHRRIPGGSSSGAAISVTDAMAAGAIGSDTGGSVRIPSALCGLVGFKPSREAVSRDGAYPLSPTLDSIGPLARSVADCAMLHSILSEAPPLASTAQSMPLRLGHITNYVTDGMDDEVSTTYAHALDRIAASGVVVEAVRIASFEQISAMNAVATYPGLEAYAAQRHRLDREGNQFDPQVRRRMEAAGKLPSSALAELGAARQTFIDEALAELSPFDAVIMPTVPTIAPPIDALADDATYAAVNLLMLRNPTTINLFGGCAVTLPLVSASGAPVGLSLAAGPGKDWTLLSIAARIETMLQGTDTEEVDCTGT